MNLSHVELNKTLFAVILNQVRFPGLILFIGRSGQLGVNLW